MGPWSKFGAVAVFALLSAGGWWALQPVPHGFSTDDERTPIEAIVKVAENLYLVPGGGCNTAVFVTSRGVVLVDTKYGVAWPALMDQVRTVTDLPVTHIINTHFHGDHTGGNRFAPPTAEVILHENAAQHLASLESHLSPDRQPRQARTYTGTLRLFDGDDAIDLYAVGPAHTDGDTFVIFRKARVMHAGDVFPDLMAPIINLEFGGNGVGFPAEIDKAVRSISGVDRIITGHGPVTGWHALQDFGEFTQDMLNYVRAEMRFGRDKYRVFRAYRPPAKFSGYNLERQFDTLDEIDRSIRPRWQRIF